MTIFLINKHTLQIDDFYFKCSIGKNGVTKRKNEGDCKTPIGTFTIGKLFLIYISKKSPLETPRNIRTEKSIKIIDENLDFDDERKLLIKKLNKLYEIKGQINHPIYGKMKSEKIQFLIKHHTIHHLNQFNLI